LGWEGKGEMREGKEEGEGEEREGGNLPYQ